MSLSCITEYLSNNLQSIQTQLANGECRFLSDGSGDVADGFGFTAQNFAPRTTEFFPCTWTAKKIDEKIIADQTRPLAGYEIVIPKTIDGAETIVKPSDRIEIKFKRSSSQTETLEIVARLNESNVFWRIYAIDIDDEN